jgi:hypothetical protein
MNHDTKQGALRRMYGVCFLSNASIRMAQTAKTNKSEIFFAIVGGGVQLGPLGIAATNRPIVPAPGGL